MKDSIIYENICLLNKVDDLLSNDSTIERLLLIEKKRRSVSPHSLIFLGIKNVSDYHWCAMKSYYDSKEDEHLFFRIYLKDRLRYSVLLSLIDHVPDDDIELLTVGSKITLENVISLMPAISKFSSNQSMPDDVIETPITIGNKLHQENNKSRMTIRWNFQWREFVLIGVPDGISDDTVYEFKTCSSKYLYNFSKWPAIAQANIYGLFYGLSKKEIEFKIFSEDKPIFVKERVKKRDAKDTLQNFALICSGHMPQAPKAWKCKKCKHTAYCSVKLTP